jgi:hypothetical protein
VAEGLTQMFVAGTSTRHPWEKWLRPSWASLLAKVASVGSITRSPNSLKRGVAALCKLTGACSISMASTWKCVMETRSTPPSF